MARWMKMSRGLASGLAGLLLAAGPGVARDEDGAEPGLKKGRVELSSSASLARVSQDDESYTILNLPLRVGRLITDRFQLEGELLLTHVSEDNDSSTGTVFSANALYHLTTGKRWAPFVLAGGGYGNAVELFTLAGDLDTGISVLNVGAGVRTFLGRHAGVRVEYRFSRYSGEDGDGSRDIAYKTHRVFFGLSLWFK